MVDTAEAMASVGTMARTVYVGLRLPAKEGRKVRECCVWECGSRSRVGDLDRGKLSLVAMAYFSW